MTDGFLKKVLSIILPAIFFCSISHGPAMSASDEDMQTLGLYYEPNDLVVTATRNPQLISQTAENVTVITAKEIEMMGAHSLMDIFANVPGIQSSDLGGVGIYNEFSIWGADANNHILMMIDGVTMNFLSTGYLNLQGLPIQNIERIEIVKGPGSSSWGSALGGVVNIVTKSPNEDKKFGGTASFSAGERGTRDSRGELSGTAGPLGYYVYAGNLRSGGFYPNTAIDQNDFYGKLRWELPNRGNLQFTIFYDRTASGNADRIADGFFDRVHQQTFFSTLALNYPLTDKIDLDLSLRTKRLRFNDTGTDFDYDPDIGITDIIDTFDVKTRETTYGGSAKLTWRERINTLTVGADYDFLESYVDPNTIPLDIINLRSDKYGVFLNDILVLGDFAFTPGIRYDRMKPVGDFVSPSIGIAWNPTGKITLRAYAAHGYSLPVLLSDSTQERVTSVQAGVETSYIPWLWLKGTFFWNRLTHIQDFDENGDTIYLKRIKQGVEIEGKSVPLFNTAISAGYTFVDTKDDDTNETLTGVPRHLLKVGVHYNDIKHTFRGSLLGRYGWLNGDPAYNGRWSAMIWDLNLSKQIFDIKGNKLELFFNAHNLFNGSQYSYDYAKNARRWFEGGIKFEF